MYGICMQIWYDYSYSTLTNKNVEKTDENKDQLNIFQVGRMPCMLNST